MSEEDLCRNELIGLDRWRRIRPDRQLEIADSIKTVAHRPSFFDKECCEFAPVEESRLGFLLGRSVRHLQRLHSN